MPENIMPEYCIHGLDERTCKFCKKKNETEPIRSAEILTTKTGQPALILRENINGYLVFAIKGSEGEILTMRKTDLKPLNSYEKSFTDYLLGRFCSWS